MNKVVARFNDGRVLKGMTADFAPDKDRFHLRERTAPPGASLTQISMASLKAFFFVKDFEGDPSRAERPEILPAVSPCGRPIRVVFEDGEVMVGTTMGYKPDRTGFFVTPSDAESNNERCWVVTAATREVGFLA